LKKNEFSLASKVGKTYLCIRLWKASNFWIISFPIYCNWFCGNRRI